MESSQDTTPGAVVFANFIGCLVFSREIQLLEYFFFLLFVQIIEARVQISGFNRQEFTQPCAN